MASGVFVKALLIYTPKYNGCTPAGNILSAAKLFIKLLNKVKTGHDTRGNKATRSWQAGREP